ncbi:MAG TPA: AraC family transcriptional regulator [Xanthobacteraceae bacterium]
MVMPVSFSTSGLRGQDRLDAWRSFYNPVLDVVTNQPAGEFDAKTQLWILGSFAIGRTKSPPVQVTRTKKHLKHDPVDHWVISYCAHGAHTTRTAGISAEVPARVPFLWSLGQEFTHERTNAERIQLILARDGFGDIESVLDAALGSALNTPLGLLLGDYMAALERHLKGLTEADLPRLKDAVAAMVGAAVAPTVERVAVAKRQIDLGRMERVRQVVRRHLRTPTLRPTTLCRLVGMSRSNLYRLLEAKGGIAQYIQQQRLLEAHSLLCNLGDRPSITALAEDFCFTDVSSFSRAFRREFGYSPSDARPAAISGLPVIPPRRRSSGKLDFADLLHGF